MSTHVRARRPRVGGSVYYRDKNDRTLSVRTLCGAPVTDKDVDYATANTKKFRVSGWPCCLECLQIQDDLQAKIIDALPDAFPALTRHAEKG